MKVTLETKQRHVLLFFIVGNLNSQVKQFFKLSGQTVGVGACVKHLDVVLSVLPVFLDRHYEVLPI